MGYSSLLNEINSKLVVLVGKTRLRNSIYMGILAIVIPTVYSHILIVFVKGPKHTPGLFFSTMLHAVQFTHNCLHWFLPSRTLLC